MLVRAGIIAGRDVDNTIFRFFSSPALPVPDPDRRQQFVHTDDVARFTAEAVSHTHTGAVNITGTGTITMREIAQIIERPLIRVPERALRTAIGAAWKLGVSELAPGEIGGLLYMPIVDTTRLHDEWGSPARGRAAPPSRTWLAPPTAWSPWARRPSRCPGGYLLVQPNTWVPCAQSCCGAPTQTK